MKRAVAVRPLIYILLEMVLGGVLISMAEGEFRDETIVLLGAMGLTLAIVYTVLSVFPLGDHYIFLLTSVLAVWGVVMLLRLQTGHGQKQVIWFSVGAAVFLVMALLFKMLDIWDKINLFYVSASVLLFVVTALAGSVSHGARSWLTVGSLSFQPSEVIKVIFILVLSSIYTHEPKKRKDKLLRRYDTKLGRNIASTAVSYIFLGFLVLQRDWGTAVLFFAIYIAYLAIYGGEKRFLIANFVLGVLGGTAGVMTMSHIQTRIDVWLHPFDDVSHKGYQITQSLFAIGEGGFTGRGIGSGSPYYIPEVHTDFIFSAICEEMGLLGGMAVIMLYFVLVYRAFKISLTTTNEFNKAVAMGIGVMIGVQTFIILGGVTKFIPLTGITLPFVSYGGSSMVAAFASLGILQGISARGEEAADEI